MEIPLCPHSFNGKDLIKVLDLLARFTSKPKNEKTSEAQAFLTLPSFLEVFAFSQYDFMVGVTPSIGGGFTRWPKAVQFLLTNYTQAKDSTKEVQNF